MSQEDNSNWQKKFTGSIHINQTNSSNWSSGSGNSFASTFELNYQFNYQKGSKTWKNDFDGEIGFTNVSGSKRLLKNIDQFTFESRYSWLVKKNTFITLYLNLNSQFSKGYNPDAENEDYMTNFFAPAFIIEGIAYNYTNEKTGLETILTVLSAKHTLVLDRNINPEFFGLSKDKRTRTEIGAFFKLNYQKEIFKNTQLTSKLLIFKNYNSTWNETDISSSLNFTISANNWLSMSLNLNLIYDNDTQISVYEDLDFDGDNEFSYASSKLQFQQNLGIGINFKL
jgi:hypothetical protein